MELKDYQIDGRGETLLIREVKDFDLARTLECGQCFRWNKEEDGSYTGVVRGKVANVSMKDGALAFRNVSAEEIRDIWFDYFDLGTDYGAIKKALSRDSVMKQAVEYGDGIRLLRQEPWEALISFILSSNNNIPRIKKIIRDICETYGNEISFNGRTFFSFPAAEALAQCTLQQLETCRAGYRCGYIHRTAAKVASGEFDLTMMGKLPVKEAREYLLTLPGVGGKVADCVLLFSGSAQEAFPTDVWIKRVMEELYFEKEASTEDIGRFAAERFGSHAGIAQQFLFYYARGMKIGAK